MSQEKPLLVIKNLVYNHEPYLRQCLDGFVMQKTSFPFYAIVHDDASTDNSAAIISEYAEMYPDIIHPILETENQYRKGDGSLDRVIDEAIEASGAKYIALCEGDDYWTDPLKLQKQLDYLEAHDECGMICGSSNVFIQDENKFQGVQGTPGDEVFENLYHGSSDLFTATVVMRKSVYLQYMKETKNLYPFGLTIDTALYYWFGVNSHIHYIAEPTAVYRVLSNSACHSTDPRMTLKMMQRYLDVKMIFLSYCHGISDEKFSFMLREIRNYEQQVIDYAQFVKEQELRSTKRYRVGAFLAKLFSK